MEGQLLEQIHTVSRIASAKMLRVRWAYYLSIPSVVYWIVLVGWSSFWFPVVFGPRHVAMTGCRTCGARFLMGPGGSASGQ